MSAVPRCLRSVHCCTITSLIFALICLATTLFLWIGFPIVFNRILKSQIILQQFKDGQLSENTYLWAHPPSNTVMNFYMYNVNNVDEILYYGGKPNVTEVGPFAVREEEVKRDLSFSEDGTTVGYKNYKTYYFDASLSCPECDYTRTLWMPSLIGVGTLEDMQDPKYNMSKTAKQIVEYTMLLVGEYPFIQVQFGKMVFDGYADPLLSAAHSKVIKWISDTFNNGKSIIKIPVPDMPLMAMFYNYNNTNDESYVIDTGKADVEKMGQVREWAGMDLLPTDWWKDKQARMLNGTDSGSFVKSGISESDKPQLFNSFMCRSFTMEFGGKTTTKGVPTYRFQSTHETFDTTLPENAGFRYANYEKVNYYPDWPQCSNSTRIASDRCDVLQLDCALSSNMCHACCHKSLVHGTYLLPPGMYPIACYPGKNQQPPFRLLYTAPHFGQSPKEVQDSIIGNNPKGDDKDIPFVYDYEPKTGGPMNINFRFQVAMPVYNNKERVLSSQFPNTILPVFWVDSHGAVKDFVVDLLRLSSVTVPTIVFWVKIATTVLTVALVVFAVTFQWYCRRRRSGADDSSYKLNGNSGL